MNILNGGKHADNTLDFQEFMIVPMGLPSFSEALRAGAEIFHTLKKLLHEKASHGGRRRGRLRARPAGERGGARRHHRGDREGRLQAGQGHRHRARRRGQRVLDKDEQEATSSRARARSWTARRWSTFYRKLVEQFPIVSIEDGLAENDWDGWKS